MIQEEQAPVYSAECDMCKTDFECPFEGWSIFMSKDHMTDSMSNRNWHIDGDTCYCPKCHEIDDDDNLILKPFNP